MTAQVNEATNYSKDIFEPVQEISSQSIVITWFKDLVTWWYITMPVWYILSLRRLLTIIDDQFSISILITHFFTPWHRDFSFVGILIGIVMKLLFLPIGIIVFLFSLCIYIAFILLWVILPIVTIVGIVFTPLISLIPQ